MKTEAQESKQFTVFEHLMYGAAWVAAAITVVALLFDFSGFREIFRWSGVDLIIEVLVGWAVIWLIVFVVAGAFQLLSYRTPIPPVVKQDEG